MTVALQTDVLVSTCPGLLQTECSRLKGLEPSVRMRIITHAKHVASATPSQCGEAVKARPAAPRLYSRQDR
jgi:hypothetical protein